MGGNRRYWRITQEYGRGSVAVCGLAVEDGRVVEAAPFLWWAKGKAWADVKVKLKARGARGEPMDDDGGTGS